MNIFLILMVSISMTGYQYYNKIKSYIAGREEFSSVEENQLKFSLGCLKEMHLKNVNFHNMFKERLPINTLIANDKTCGINQDKMFSIKFCVDATNKLISSSGKGGNGGKSGNSAINPDACFADDNTMQYVVSVLDSDIDTKQYAMILNEDVSFTSASGNLKGPASAKTIPDSVLKSLPANVRIPNNCAILIHAATTAETKLAIKKNETDGKLKDYIENGLVEKCENYEDYNSDGNTHKDQCLSKGGWLYSPQSCTWICPQLTIDEISQWKEFKECQKNGGLLVIKELTSAGKNFACVPDYKDLFSKNICNGKNGFIEVIEIGQGKNKKFAAACMERKKSESGCSVCQIPVPDLSNGKWLCSLPREESAIKSGIVNINEAMAYNAISKNFRKNSNSDVKYIREAGCLKGCEGYLTGTIQETGGLFYQIKWDPSQRLFKCTGCPAGQYEQAQGNGVIKCATPKCTGNLVYVEEIDRCVAMKWCKFKLSAEAMAQRGIFRGDINGNCGPMSNDKKFIRSILGLDKADVDIKVSTLFRKTYNPENKCFYCRIALPEPINGSFRNRSIIEKLLSEIKDLASVKLISDLHANELDNPQKPKDELSDTIDQDSYTIDANNYPPYVGSDKNIGKYLQIPYEEAIKHTTKETDLMYCAEDINSYKKIHKETKTGPSSTGTVSCMNCKAGSSPGQCKYSAGKTVSGYTSFVKEKASDKTGKRLDLIMSNTDASNNDGYASGLGGTLLDWKKYISMWEKNNQCGMVCNFKDKGCNVVQGYKRIYRNTEFSNCSDNNTLSGYPGSAEGGWSGAIRDFDINQKPFGIPSVKTLEYTYGNITEKVQIPQISAADVKLLLEGKKSLSLNYCSIYIEGGGEVRGGSTLVKYLYDKDSGKTLCWPRLSVMGPESEGKGTYKPNTDSQLFGGGSGERIENCEKDDIFGTQTCIGQILRDDKGEGLELSGILTNSGEQAKYTTKLMEISFKNSITCDYANDRCTIKRGVSPEPCKGEIKTLYYDIISLLVDKSIINPNAITEYKKDTTGICKEGYRKSVTWRYKPVKFKLDKNETLKSKVLVSNCSFCEKVLFTETTVDSRNPKVKDFGDEDGIANYYLGSWKLKRIKGDNNSYTIKVDKLVGGNPLQLGIATIPVFRVDPSMTLSDYEKAISSDWGKYVDPFDAFVDMSTDNKDFIGAKLKIRTKAKPTNANVIKVPLLKSDFLEKAKMGDNQKLNNSMVEKGGVVNFYGCFSTNGVCMRKKAGICPAGMIATINTQSNIECHTYVWNSHRAGCFTSGNKLIHQLRGKNSIASGSGKGINEESGTGAHGRMGCLNGYKLVNGSNGLMCDKYVNQSGSSVKHCRNKGNNKYDLTPIFSDGKLSFECINKKSGKICFDVVTDNSNTNAGNRCKAGSIEIIPLGTTVNREGKAVEKYKSVAKKDDKTSSTCTYYKIETDPTTDDFGRKFIINRASSMFIANDCFVCL